MLNEKLIQEIVKRIVENHNPEKLLLYGSQANGDTNKDSDIDLLVIKNSDLPRYKRSRKIRFLLKGLKLPFDIIEYTPEEIEKWKNVKNSFIYNVFHSSKVLYEREN